MRVEIRRRIEYFCLVERRVFEGSSFLGREGLFGEVVRV